VFLRYNNKHKGFKCIDLSTGRTYISQDVIFDENVFTFSKLHPNAAPRVRAEISFLPSSLFRAGGGLVCDQLTNASDATNSCEELHKTQAEAANIGESSECTVPRDDSLRSNVQIGDPSRAGTAPGADSSCSGAAPGAGQFSRSG
jgi:hypothetical protein